MSDWVQQDSLVSHSFYPPGLFFPSSCSTVRPSLSVFTFILEPFSSFLLLSLPHSSTPCLAFTSITLPHPLHSTLHDIDSSSVFLITTHSHPSSPTLHSPLYPTSLTHRSGSTSFLTLYT